MGAWWSRQRQDEAADLRVLFDALDRNADGVLSAEEMCALFAEAGLPVSRRGVEQFMARHRATPSGLWSREDFLAVFTQVAALWRALDANGDGQLTVDELAPHIGPEAQALLRRWDANHDGTLCFAEFLLMYEAASQHELARMLGFLVASPLSFHDSPLLAGLAREAHAGDESNATPSSHLLVSGALGGAVSKTLVAPISRLALLMQLHSDAPVSELLKRLVSNDDGVRGLWRGNLSSVLKIAPSVAINVTTYDRVKALLRNEDGSYGVAVQLAAGATAGAVSLALTYPMDALRTHMSLDGPATSMTGALRALVVEGKIFCGLPLALLEVMPAVAIQMTLLERIKAWFVRRRTLDRTATTTVPELVAACSVASAVGCVVTYPLVVVRRHQQVTGLRAGATFRGLWAHGGPRALFRGLGVNLAQVVPAISCSFLCFEWSKSLLRRQRHEQPE